MIAPDFGFNRDRQIGLVSGVDKDEANGAIAGDLMLLGAAQIGHEPDDAIVAIGPCFDRSRPQSHGRAGCQHTDPDALDDVPDAIGRGFRGHRG